MFSLLLGLLFWQSTSLYISPMHCQPLTRNQGSCCLSAPTPVYQRLLSWNLCFFKFLLVFDSSRMLEVSLLISPPQRLAFSSLFLGGTYQGHIFKARGYSQEIRIRPYKFGSIARADWTYSGARSSRRSRDSKSVVTINLFKCSSGV